MYTHILEAALNDRSRSDTTTTMGARLSFLLECRQRLGFMVSDSDSDWGSAALANQVAYDIALIDVARSVGLACDPSSFAQPQRRRLELERQLIERGVRLDEIDQPASSPRENR